MKSKTWKLLGGAIVVILLLGMLYTNFTNPRKVLAGSKAVQEVNEFFKALNKEEAKLKKIDGKKEILVKINEKISDIKVTPRTVLSTAFCSFPSSPSSPKKALICCIIIAKLKKTREIICNDCIVFTEWKEFIRDNGNITPLAREGLRTLCENIREEAKHDIFNNVTSYRRRAAAYISILEEINTKIVERYQFNSAANIPEECIHSIQGALATKNK